MIYLVSACLLGKKCRYDGKSKPSEDVLAFLKGKKYLPICPEVAGGLLIPHPPAEIVDGDGNGVWQGNARVINALGIDVTDAFCAGAKAVLQTAKNHGATVAILKSKSPSCGDTTIYNGTFQRRLREGQGVTAALLKKEGICIFNEENISKIVDE